MKTGKKSNNPTVIVQTCDAYSHLWEGWEYTFNEYWNWSLPWEVWFCTEESAPKFHNDKIKIFQTGKEKFSTRLIKILESVDSDHIFYMQEDMWPRRTPEAETLLLCHEIIQNDFVDGIKFHLLAQQYKDMILEEYRGTKFLRHGKNGDWAYCHQAALWKRRSLLNVQREGEDPLQNEINTTHRFWSSHPNAIVLLYHCPWYSLPGVSWRGNISEYGQQIMYELECNKRAESLIEGTG